ncbi:MAG: UDP-N-acetylglucosamine 1-carboxyvinyltransferase [Candidatus Berkelbacteria bacterium Licking1014_7]|uniref:UDP-N-acetylglucosamine 1-carboxyvinyltransferase n=1 Tax=Candidatus Berkelbacteria bacterium Licking1014_7 TaxID=2017147 RepID=A0A554LJ89_9BACT|nr:MAG: UDP-N-acetylglucosamine 1-carboxyvinyltransferase [Candidatus Berkelbacteria bacterium Licking1014_7]
MSEFIITGPTQLKGEVTPSGAKNAALKQIAAAILTDELMVLKNLPKILDVENMLLLIEKLGAEVEWVESQTVKINCKNLSVYEIDSQLSGVMRASVVLVGPLLARFGKAVLPSTGGDRIGARSINTHLSGFEKLGVKIEYKNNKYFFDAKNAHAAEFFLDEMSVTATENLIMFSSCLAGRTVLRGAASEPEIEDLCLMLNKMGAKITGAGTQRIEIQGINPVRNSSGALNPAEIILKSNPDAEQRGIISNRVKKVKKLSGCEHSIIPDRIEIGTFACAVAASRGEVIIKNVILEHIENLLMRFEKMGVKYKFKARNLKHEIQNRTWGDLKIYPSKNLKPIYIDTRPYPGFSTDLQAPMALLLTQAQGKSRIFETLFEGRLDYAKELQKMGAKIENPDEHNIIITGPTGLKGAPVGTADIRAGATLVLAGIIATGKTEVNQIEILERGYENFEDKLRSLGAKIERN